MTQTPEQRRAYQREWVVRNRSKVNKTSRAWRERNIDRERERDRRPRQRDREKANSAAHLRDSHGMRPEDWAALWQAQSGRCYLCNAPLGTGKMVHIDHDHQHCPRNKSCRVCRRGLACFDCNLSIGHAGDDPARLRQMADALELAQEAFRQRVAAKGVQPSMFD